MSKNNPITCVSLDIYPSWIELWVHRDNTFNNYSFTTTRKHKSTKIRCERMTRIAAERSKVAYRNVTGELPPAE